MNRLRAYLRRRWQRPVLRPLALFGPVVVLIVALPLLRPLRHPSAVSDDETLRLATIRALVEQRTLAVNTTLAPHVNRHVVRRDGTLYSEQPPMMALLLAPPAWVMTRLGLSFDENSLLISYLLTLLGVTLPVAIAAGLIYRMGRLFELPRRWRVGLSLAVVFGSGLISYAVVLNPHAPAAALVLATAACLIYVASLERASLRWIWLLLGGVSAGLAATLDPSAAVLLLLFMFVIAAMRFPIAHRAGGVLLYLLGAAGPLLLHANWNIPVTGDWLPATLHEELSRGRSTPPPSASEFYDEDDPRRFSLFRGIYRPVAWIVQALFGRHGIVSHFPVVLIGVAGVFAVMHRHWPPSTKTLAAATLIGGGTIVLLYCVWRADWRGAMFASRWFVVFLPMLVFWLGAWVRRSHAPVAWVFAGVLLGFSILVSLAGATNPYPRDGFRGYTALEATRRLLSAHPSIPPEDALVDTDDSAR